MATVGCYRQLAESVEKVQTRGPFRLRRIHMARLGWVESLHKLQETEGPDRILGGAPANTRFWIVSGPDVVLPK